MKQEQKTNGLQQLTFPVIAGISLLFSCGVLTYIFAASEDVVYSDYIRLVNEYFPNLLDPEKFLVPDLLTRMPLTYFFRYINTQLFHYSVNFDRVVSVAGIFGASLILIRYCLDTKLSRWCFPGIFIILFSLSKREMLLNGSGYIHFMTYIPFFLQFYWMNLLHQGKDTKQLLSGLKILPWITIIFIAGPYCAVFFVTVIIGYLLIFHTNAFLQKKERISLLLNMILPFALYMLSNSFAIEDNAGAYDMSLLAVLFQFPTFIFRFLLCGFASAAVGGDLLEYMTLYEVLPKGMVYLIGVFVLLAYASAAFIYFKEGLCRETVLPFLLLVMGFGNHLIVFLGRYIFLRETYAWSSRYFLQYEVGAIGILLIAALSFQKRHTTGARRVKDSFLYRHCRELLLTGTVLLLIGNIITSGFEIRDIPERKYLFQLMKETELNYRYESDGILDGLFEYRHGADKIRNAFGILEENKLNVFYEPGGK